MNMQFVKPLLPTYAISAKNDVILLNSSATKTILWLVYTKNKSSSNYTGPEVTKLFQAHFS